MALSFRSLRGVAAALVVLMGLPAAAQDSYRIRPGDVLQIEVIEDPGLNRAALVSPDGRITMPLVGALRASGRTVEEVQADLIARLAPNFAAPPNVFVGIQEIFVPPERPQGPVLPPARDDIYALGEVERPGRLEIVPGSTLLQAFAEMGGFSRFAATHRIQLRRVDASGQETVYTIDYDAILDGRSSAGLTTVQEGDVIVVPTRTLFE